MENWVDPQWGQLVDSQSLVTVLLWVRGVAVSYVCSVLACNIWVEADKEEKSEPKVLVRVSGKS